MTNFNGRVAIVTGASRGIGRAIAAELAARGARVVVAARERHAEDAAQEITAAGGTAVAATVDVTDPPSVAAMVDLALERFGRLDVLVSNAGVARDQLLPRMRREDWDVVLATNLTAAFACAQAAVRPMLKQRWGRIVCIGSVVGLTGNAGQVNYAASKAGLIGFARALAREVGSRGITVNVVAPGYIETDMTRTVRSEAQNAWMAQIPIGRLGTPADVAAAVCFLASDEASYITGQVLGVNGGLYM